MPPITFALILLNVLVYALAVTTGPEIVRVFGLWPPGSRRRVPCLAARHLQFSARVAAAPGIQHGRHLDVRRRAGKALERPALPADLSIERGCRRHDADHRQRLLPPRSGPGHRRLGRRVRSAAGLCTVLPHPRHQHRFPALHPDPGTDVCTRLRRRSSSCSASPTPPKASRISPIWGVCSVAGRGCSISAGAGCSANSRASSRHHSGERVSP